MIRVLQYHEGELDSPRAALKRHHGIECVIVRDARPVETVGLSFTRGDVTLYRYNRKSNGALTWLVELRLYTPPDIEWSRTWVLDGGPTDDEVQTLLMTDAQTGSYL
jgi:hypothetical protein